VVVPRRDALTPLPATGVPFAARGGHALAHSPAHELVVPESFVNRYSVRPCESTRIVPSEVLAVPTLAGAADVFGVVDAVAPPPPHAATASGVSANPAALARIAIGLDG
jgi:hypothetical protein